MSVEEDYRKLWRDFYCAALSNVPELKIYIQQSSYKDDFIPLDELNDLKLKLKIAAIVADESIEIYLQKRNKLKEYNLQAFK